MPSKLFRKILIALAVPFILFEVVCWIFQPFPLQPDSVLDLNNDIPGFKRQVQIKTGKDQVRFLGWTQGEKPAGAVRILYVGGAATIGFLQGAEDTWWGVLHTSLKKKGYKVETAARGFDRAGIVGMAAGIAPVVEDLKPDIIIVNSGYDDVIIHPADYKYDKEKLEKLAPPPPPTGWKETVVKISQTARFFRYRSRMSEINKFQNEMGRKDVYKNFLEEKRAMVLNSPRSAGIQREGAANDPLQEYLDGLKAFRDIAKKNGATLLLTGEPTLENTIMLPAHMERLLAYISLSQPRDDGKFNQIFRPDPAWVTSELNRFAAETEKFAVANNVPFLDLNGQVDRTLENFFSDAILTNAGSAAAAAVLEPFVEPVVKTKAGK